MEKVNSLFEKVRASVKKNFRFATLDFLFIIAFVNVFQAVFGAENSIVGVIFTIMMASSMVRDMTAAPLRHLCMQALVLVLMAVAACFVATLSPVPALLVNFAAVFVILYVFTYEHASHMYFPYILSYLFLVFISPITPEQLPKRVLGMLVGAVCIILYQFVMGRKRVVETTRDALSAILAEARQCIECLLDGKGNPDDPQTVRENLYKLSRMVYERRRKPLCVSDASFAMIDSGRGLEYLILQLYDLEGPVTPERAKLLHWVLEQLNAFEAFVQKKQKALEPFAIPEDDPAADGLCDSVEYIRSRLLHMTDPEKRTFYRPTALSLSVRIKAALDVSPVRLIYALRVAVLLAAATLLVQAFSLPHGKWLLFTIASVSLPYADDVGRKAKKRLIATAVGGVASVALYALIPSMAGRTAVMMLSGYLSFYFSDYTGTYACSTVGALGGAVLMNSFGWAEVGSMLAVRLGYILLGVVVAMVFNCLVFPFSRRLATRQLWTKYARTTELLTEVCRQENADPQIYYSLVIQTYLLEEKLCQNAKDANWEGLAGLLKKCRAEVRRAHAGNRITERAMAPAAN
ncbi:FUSC family protein [Clostridium sp. D33t1_170424_F3]|uniref:FUSC family protein n=1 Tax=Clostridium sp. D33t1_170424_F3 TaxID=2787099 RepID=UPI0018A91725|nr:FUSC family protein [Clostridium sp. D33t1_170424_F3]